MWFIYCFHVFKALFPWKLLVIFPLLSCTHNQSYFYLSSSKLQSLFCNSLIADRWISNLNHPIWQNRRMSSYVSEMHSTSSCDKSTQVLEHSNYSSPQTPHHIFGLVVEAAEEHWNQRQVVKILESWAVAAMLTCITEKSRKDRSTRHCYVTSYSLFLRVLDTGKKIIKTNNW